jgi:hypothetical protein
MGRFFKNYISYSLPIKMNVGIGNITPSDFFKYAVFSLPVEFFAEAGKVAFLRTASFYTV